MKCKKHTRYKGIYKPRTECLDCWKIHVANIEKKLADLYRDMDRLGDELENYK